MAHIQPRREEATSLPCAEVEVCGNPASCMSFAATSPATLAPIESLCHWICSRYFQLFIVTFVMVPMTSDL